MSKTILLTGGTGFLGGNLGYEFLKKGYYVIFVARGQRGNSAVERVISVLDTLEPGFSAEYKNSFEVWDGDVVNVHLGLNKSLIQKWKGKIDEVWHSAAVLNFRDTYETITEAININGTVNVLNTAKELGVKRFHHISTAYVSGKCPGKVMEHLEIHEYNFRNPYERTKYDAEQEVRKKSEAYGFDTTIYRPSVIVGDSKTGFALSFTGIYNIAKMFIMIRRLLERKFQIALEQFNMAGIYFDNETCTFPIKIPCNKKGTVNIVPIDYVVDTIIKLSEKKEGIGLFILQILILPKSLK